MKQLITWHSHARRIRAQGHDPRRIAAELGKALSAVRYVLGPMGRPESIPPASHKPKPARQPPRTVVLSAGARLVEPHTPRVPRVTLDEGALTAAAVAFAMGEIDKAELLRRITR
jgi:hypothetical protein